MDKKFYVYILATGKHGTLYIGLTSNLLKRIWEHKYKVFEGFTEKHDVSELVYFEIYDTFDEAVKREKNMKAWQRAWKIHLIEESNPHWRDIYDEINR